MKYDEYLRRTLGWLWHYTTLGPDKWRKHYKLIRRGFLCKLDPQTMARSLFI